MYMQELLEVAIGLIFVWMVLSIAAMQIQEWVANILGKRSSDLEESIREMLGDPEKVKEFYKHPLINSLIKPISESNKSNIIKLEAKADRNVIEQIRLWWIKRKPSYIPSKNFSLALFDVVANAGTAHSPLHSKLNQLRDEVDSFDAGDRETVKAFLERIYEVGQKAAKTEPGSDIRNNIKQELKDQISRLGRKYQPLEQYTNQLNTELNNAESNLSAFFKSEQVLDQVRAGAIALGTNKSLTKTINSLLAGVEETAAGADKGLAMGRKNVEEWFDNSMERMSGWYKRWAQKRIFVIGLALALLLNVDSIALAEHLWREPAVRQALIATSEKFVIENKDGANPEAVEPEEAIKQFQERFKGLTLPIGWVLETYDGDKKVKLFANEDEVVGICPQIDRDKYRAGVQPVFCYEIKDPPTSGFEISTKMLGILFTALATMQGAPYWFDILKKLINVRSSGVNPAEKPKGTTPTERERV